MVTWIKIRITRSLNDNVMKLCSIVQNLFKFMQRYFHRILFRSCKFAAWCLGGSFFPDTVYGNVKHIINTRLQDPSPQHAGTAAIYTEKLDHSEVPSDKIRTSTSGSTKIRWADGHCYKLATYQNIIDPCIDPICNHSCDIRTLLTLFWVWTLWTLLWIK